MAHRCARGAPALDGRGRWSGPRAAESGFVSGQRSAAEPENRQGDSRGEFALCDPRRSQAITGASVRLAYVAHTHPYSPRPRAQRRVRDATVFRPAEVGRSDGQCRCGACTAARSRPVLKTRAPQSIGPPSPRLRRVRRSSRQSFGPPRSKRSQSSRGPTLEVDANHGSRRPAHLSSWGWLLDKCRDRGEVARDFCVLPSPFSLLP